MKNQREWAKFEEKFNKTFGSGSLVNASDISPYDIIPTGSLTLDYVLGVGGLVEGRLVEMWGPEGVGKTTLSLIMLSEAQKKHPDKQVAFIDMEQKLDLKWAETHDVDLSRTYIVKPNNAEVVADAMKQIVSSGFFSMVVLDSIGAMIPEVEKEKEAKDAVMAQQARIVTRMVKIAAVEARKTNTAVVLLNQVRANLSYGADTTTGGGFALKHVTTMKFHIKRSGDIYTQKVIGQEKEVPVGHGIAIRVERNGVAPGYKTAKLALFHVGTEKYGPIGIDKADEAATLGINLGVIEQGGAWYTMPDGERVQGRDKVVGLLREDPAMVEDIRTKVIATNASDIKAEEETEAEVDELGNDKPAFRKGTPE